MTTDTYNETTCDNPYTCVCQTGNTETIWQKDLEQLAPFFFLLDHPGVADALKCLANRVADAIEAIEDEVQEAAFTVGAQDLEYFKMAVPRLIAEFQHIAGEVPNQVTRSGDLFEFTFGLPGTEGELDEDLEE